MEASGYSRNNQPSNANSKFNDLINNTLLYGRGLVNKGENLGTTYRTEADLTNYSYLEPTQKTCTFKHTEEIIRENASKDMKQLNYEVKFVKADPINDYINSKISNHAQRLRQSSQQQREREVVPTFTPTRFEDTFQEDRGTSEPRNEAINDDNLSFGDNNEGQANEDAVQDSDPQREPSERNNDSGRKEEYRPRENGSNKRDEPLYTESAYRPEESYFERTTQERQDSYNRQEYIENLRKTYTADVAEVVDRTPNKSVVNLNESYLINQYHEMKARDATLKKSLLKFASNRINPPKFLVDVLDAFFSLLFGVYSRIENHYFTIQEKKYFLFKAYLQNIDELGDVTNHLKMYIETQGLPIRNITKADEALVRYNSSCKRTRALDYKEVTDQLAAFVQFHVEYYHILRVIIIITVRN